MTYPWTPLSRRFTDADTDAEIVVVGSGYGGGVAASRLARAGRDVMVLERGREIAPGHYPKTGEAAADAFQITLSHSGDTVGARDGLYDLRVGDDVNVLVGCGLGGTSLINANVAIEPLREVLKTWPEPYREDTGILAPYYDRARAMLGTTTYPADKTLPKLDALERAAEGLGKPFRRAPINVTFEDGYNAAGLWQPACTDCGDCVSGCNYGAKNTTLMNYLPDAKAFGATLLTGAEVIHLTRNDDTAQRNWTLHVLCLDTGDTRDVTADVVVLAAGTLGSTEILLKSERAGLPLSDTLGSRFSGNGDVWAFGYNANIPAGADRAPVFAVGAGPNAPDRPHFQPGPCITGVIDLRDTPELTDGLIIEEGVMPGALATAYAVAFPALDALMGDPSRFGDLPERLMDARDMGAVLEQHPERLPDMAYQGPVSRTVPFLVMAHDASAGHLEIEQDRVVVRWPGGGLDPAILRDETWVRRASDVLRAEYLPNPLWQDAFNNRVTTVHPLGGCPMGDDVTTGTVDADCRVFARDGTLHPGLLVCDGAALPGAVGVNPHLAITAVAERAIERFAEANAWHIDWSPAPQQDRAIIPVTPAFDIVAMLDSALATLDTLEDVIRGGKAFVIYAAFVKAWTTLAEYLEPLDLPDAATAVKPLTEGDAPDTIVLPVLKQLRTVLADIRDAVANDDLPWAITTAEDFIGDPSPAVHFPERMTGHLSAIGTHDAPPPSDPYGAAVAGPVNCTLDDTRIFAPSVKTAITPPDGTAQILSGTLSSDALGGTFGIKGTFRFLMPDAQDIDAWEMIYDGTLTPDKGTGKPLHFLGKKRLQRREGSHWWRDLTELFVTVSDDTGTPVAHGILNVGFEDLIGQARTLTFEYTDDALAQSWAHVQSLIANAPPADWPDTVAGHDFRSAFVKACLATTLARNVDAAGTAETYYRGTVFARMGGLVLRSYGGIFSYMANATAAEAGEDMPQPDGLPRPERHHPRVAPGRYLALTRYRRDETPANGAVILAGGFGTKASSFAMPTVDRTIVHELLDHDFDVWLFDYRGSGAIDASLHPFTLDDVAREDWPAALDLIRDIAQPKRLQAVVHCIGSMSLFMAILGGHARVDGIVASQLAAHPITNWFNYAKADGDVARAIAHGLPDRALAILKGLGLPADMIELAKRGLPVVDPRSPGPLDPGILFGATLDALLYTVPSFSPVPCNSPTCHRINGIFGPSYRHENLNDATHTAIRHVFGPVSTEPFIHISRIFGAGHLLSMDGKTDYLANRHLIDMPVTFIAGAKNPEMLPEATLRTQKWLADGPSPPPLDRIVFPDYGHMDCFIGKHAARDIFPRIRESLLRI
ncbi:FAD-dependent oxidoreductase [Alphaproteobacteria bacterium GH1-50]|uniref:Cholesterol oxidase n=1 Tax=Kangsaoukella pontilimi TaxID=2691042 RepID=A0A7C9ISF2_9RHOB|nr:GMC family oxidoreductase N-terminal domain-containing protein [Kangsaoukella pontilimi]MXQ09723.1 FAD-dependent oxidoreductase [Kangsaoukella pontilimi]